jgi:Rrf2 family protein
MRMSDGVEWTVHCCTLLSFLPDGECLPAVKGPYLAKHLQALTRAGVLESVPGPKGGYRLARPATEITMLEVVEAIDGPEPAFTCSEIRRRGPAGGLPAAAYAKPCGIHAVMVRADEAWRREIASSTIADLARHAAMAATPESAVRAATWFQEVTR